MHPKCILFYDDGSHQEVRISDFDAVMRHDGPVEFEITGIGMARTPAPVGSLTLGRGVMAGGDMVSLQCPICHQYDDAHDCKPAVLVGPGEAPVVVPRKPATTCMEWITTNGLTFHCKRPPSHLGDHSHPTGGNWKNEVETQCPAIGLSTSPPVRCEKNEGHGSYHAGKRPDGMTYSWVS